MEIKNVKELGTAIKAARVSLSLTQEAAAALCGVSMPFMNQLEGGKREHLSLSKVLGVCSGLGVHVHVSGVGLPSGTSDEGL